MFKKERTPILSKLLQKIPEERRLPSTFYEANIVLFLKPSTDTTKKEICKPILLRNIDSNNLNKICQNASSNTLKRLYTVIKCDSSQECKDGTLYAITTTNKQKIKNKTTTKNP